MQFIKHVCARLRSCNAGGREWQNHAETKSHEITIGVDHSGPARGCAATAHKTPSALRCINAWLVRHFAAQGVNMCQSLDTSVASSVVFSGFGPEMSRVEKR